MRFVRYSDGSSPTWGVKRENELYSLAELPEGVPSLADLTNEGYLKELRRKVDTGALSR